MLTYSGLIFKKKEEEKLEVHGRHVDPLPDDVGDPLVMNIHP